MSVDEKVRKMVRHYLDGKVTQTELADEVVVIVLTADREEAIDREEHTPDFSMFGESA